MWVMLLPVRWLVVRANRIENRNASCLGTEGGRTRAMRTAPRSQLYMCAPRDSLIFSQTQGGKNESPHLSVANASSHGHDL